MLRCPSCQANNPLSATYCAQCRVPLPALDDAGCTLRTRPRMTVVAPPSTAADVDDPALPRTHQLSELPALGGSRPSASDLLAPRGLVPARRRPQSAELPPDQTHPISQLSQVRTPTAPNAPAPKPPAPPRLRVLRGNKVNVEYPVYEGPNLIGRRDDKPVDIDIEDQEPPDRIWSSRQHAVVTLSGGLLTIEDLNSLNGTYVNRHRVYPGQKRQLTANDVIQIGAIQLRVVY